MTAKLILVASLLLVVLVASCSDSGDDSPTGSNGGTTPPDTVSFAATISPLINSRCATSSCHGSASGQGGLVLGSTSPSHATIVSVSSPNGRFVIPGNSGGSNFYLKVIPNVPTPPGGPRMPLTGGFLTTAQQTAIRNWIDQGAMDN